MERARRFLVHCWMARGGKTSDKIMTVTDRLRGVQIECQPAVKLIERYKRPEVLIYADPPYILSTRSKRMYKNEMKDTSMRSFWKRCCRILVPFYSPAMTTLCTTTDCGNGNAKNAKYRQRRAGQEPKFCGSTQ